MLIRSCDVLWEETLATSPAKRADRKRSPRRKSDATSPPGEQRDVWASRDLAAKLALELFVVFVGVSAAFALDDFRESRSQAETRRAVYSALDRELSQMAETHGPKFQRQMTEQLNAWDRAIKRGEKPLPPTFRLPGAERPPTGVWDAAVATGSIELIDPELFYELARFYNRADSAGILYQRYSEGSQSDVRPYVSQGPSAFWQSNGRPSTQVLAHVQRLRDFRQKQGELGHEARQLRAMLRTAASE